MVESGRERVKSEIMRVLGALTDDERKLFSEVIKIEAANLHLERPRVTTEILEAVRRAVK
jgi:hypothetical protein